MNEAKGEKSTQNIYYSVDYAEIVESPGYTVKGWAALPGKIADLQKILLRRQLGRNA